MIKQIRLQNLKCFEDEVFDLSPLSLLTGLNGMGKSTVIQALLLLRQNFELGLLKENKGLALNGELVQIGYSKDLLYQYFKSRVIGIEIKFEKDMKAEWKWIAEIDKDNLPLEYKKYDPRIFELALFQTNFHYINAERIGPRVYFETSNYDVINRNQLGIHGEFSANYLAEFQKNKIPIPELKHPNSDGYSLYEQVNAWLSEIRPGTRISVTPNLDMSLVGLNYQFISGMDAGNKMRPTNVGFGLSFLLPILVAILSSKPGALIIVENPEAHLHPRGQVQIGRLFALAAAQGIQLIVETHSDHILNGARVAAKEGIIKPEQTGILFFTGEAIQDRFQNYILHLKVDKNGRIDDWPEGFFDEWEKQLTKLI